MSGKLERKGKVRTKAKPMRKSKEIPLAGQLAPTETAIPPNAKKECQANNASREKTSILTTRPWRDDYVHQQLSRVLRPFGELWVIAEEQPFYSVVLDAWRIARKNHIGNNTLGSEAGERERLLYLFYLAGDSGIGFGDSGKGRKLRRAMMKRARKEGDAKFVESIKGLQKRRKKGATGFGAGTDLVLALWVPYSLWTFNDSNAVKVIAWTLRMKDGTNACVPTSQAIRRARQKFGLINWFDLGFSKPLASFDPANGVTVHLAEKRKT